MLSKKAQAVVEAFNKGYRVVDGVVISSMNRVRALKKTEGSHGSYYFFTVKSESAGKTVDVAVHRLAAYQKFGEAMFEEGILIRHLDGNSLNNSSDNLALGTAHDNAMDRPAHDRRAHAAKGNQQHSPELIAAIRADHAAGMGYKKLKKKYNLPLSTFSYYLSAKAKRSSFTHKVVETPAVLG